MNRLLTTYDKVVWLNPVPEQEWDYTQSIGITYQIMNRHMYPLTLNGLEDAMKHLAK